MYNSVEYIRVGYQPTPHEEAVHKQIKDLLRQALEIAQAAGIRVQFQYGVLAASAEDTSGKTILREPADSPDGSYTITATSNKTLIAT